MINAKYLTAAMKSAITKENKLHIFERVLMLLDDPELPAPTEESERIALIFVYCNNEFAESDIDLLLQFGDWMALELLPEMSDGDYNAEKELKDWFDGTEAYE